MLTWLLIFSLQSFAASPAVTFDETMLRQRFDRSVLNDGPNCYNTAFIAMGYMDDVIHTSTDEARFYLKNFCQLQKNKTADQAQNGALIAYYTASSDLVHVAVALGSNTVLEKYSYEGSHRASRRNSNRAGDYLFQALEKSYYFKNYSSARTKVFHCASWEEVRGVLGGILDLPAVHTLNQLRFDLAKDLEKVNPQDLDLFLESSVANYLMPLEQVLSSPAQSDLEKQYIRSLATSLLQQIYYSADGAPISCDRCSRKALRPLYDRISRLEALMARNY